MSLKYTQQIIIYVFSKISNLLILSFKKKKQYSMPKIEFNGVKKNDTGFKFQFQMNAHTTEAFLLEFSCLDYRCA